MRSIILLLLLINSNLSFSQIDSVAIHMESELEFPSQFLQLKSSIASRIDNRNNGILYSANLIFGLGIYDISSPSNIEPLLNMEINEFEGLSVSTIQQVDNQLFVGLGDFQKENPASGLAILDVTTPENPTISDIWTSENFIHGVSHLDIYDGIAYLSMMDDGLLILDVSNAEDIQFVSSYLPDLTFPSTSNGHHQGRGITKVGDTLFYTFDRGGLRAIDVSDIYHPEEVKKYINSDLISKATAAYNDVVVIGNYAYVSVDYCGLEVLDISTEPWTLVEWYDPVDCQGFNWFGADVHTNELVTACDDSLLFVSGGNSEVIAFDISNPAELIRVGSFFELDNELAAYGLHVLDDQISVSYINNPLNIPYVGNWGGLKMLSFSKMTSTSLNDVETSKAPLFFPNPAASNIQFEHFDHIKELCLFNLEGSHIENLSFADLENGQIDINHLPSGTYLLKWMSNGVAYTGKLVKI